MMERMQFYRSSGSRWALRGAVVALVMLLSVAVAHVQEQGTAASIAVGQPVAREMRGGEQHTYKIKLSDGQYVRIALEQKGIDVVLTLLAADGKSLHSFHSSLRSQATTSSPCARSRKAHRLDDMSCGSKI